MTSSAPETVTMQVTHQEEAPSGWDDLVAADPGADFFHTADWTRLAARSFPGLKPFWIEARQGGRQVGGLAGFDRVGRVPLLGPVVRLESNLEGVSGGPLVVGDLDETDRDRIFRALVEEMVHLAGGRFSRCAISLNTFQENRFGHLLADAPPWGRFSVPGSVVDLSAGREHVEAHLMSMNKRNERNRALKRGVEAFTTSDPAFLRAYYPLYLAASRVWGQSPVPLDFLEALLNLGPEKCFFSCVRFEDQVIGGHLNLVHGDRVFAWNGVTDPAHARKLFPATVVMWWDIVESCARGAHVLDLGASGGVVSLAGFKRNFGADLEERGFYVRESAGMKLLKQGQSLWSRVRRSGAEGGLRWHDRKGRS
jgi:hypothetical protein